MRIDMFAYLPDDLVLRIMLLLDAKAIACLSVVADKFKQLWITSSPVFKISNHGISSSLVPQYVNYIKRIMSLCRRRLDCPLIKLQVSWNLPESESRNKFFMDDWIKTAAMYNVRDLVIEITPEFCSVQYLPSSVMHCKLLKKLELSDCGEGRLLLSFPRSDEVILTSLESLNLSNVGLCSCYNFRKFVSFSCPELKWMSISKIWIDSVLEITHSSLVKLSINDCYCSTNFLKIIVSAHKLKTLYLNANKAGTMLDLQLSTPNLKALHFDLNSLNAFQVRENMPSLKKAVVHHLVNTLLLVEHLTLSEPLIRAISEEYGLVALKFNRVSNLVITTNHDFRDEYHLPLFMASLLRKVPNLKHLCLKGDPYNFPHYLSDRLSATMDADSWKARRLEFINDLKTVQIDFCGTRNEVEFLNYLLRNATSLEKCIVKYPSSLRSEMLKMLEGIDNSSSAAASASLCILPR